MFILFYGFVSGRPRVWSRLPTIQERARRKILESKPLPLPLNPAIAPLRRWGDVDAAAPVYSFNIIINQIGAVFAVVTFYQFLENAITANHSYLKYYRKSSPITSNHRQSPSNHHENHQPITFQSPLLHKEFPVYCFHVGLRVSIISAVLSTFNVKDSKSHDMHSESS